jgi:ribA/ribD-fused uncharacterized protein
MLDITDMIHDFSGSYAFLSNFFVSPLWYKGKEWPTVEHVFQAHKSVHEAEREMIRMAATPGKAKRMGRKIVTLRHDWEEVKVDLMLALLRLKFTQHPDLGDKLRLTGKVLLGEGNRWHDNFWGNCRCPECEDIEGHNMLGKLLMRVRDEISVPAGTMEK